MPHPDLEEDLPAMGDQHNNYNYPVSVCAARLCIWCVVLCISIYVCIYVAKTGCLGPYCLEISY